MRIVLIGILLFITSCSSVHFYSEGESNVAISQQKFEQENPAIFEESREFFLWGSVPSPQKVNLGKTVLEKEHYQNSSVSFEVYRTFGDILTAIFTFGMYSPVHYKVSIIGKQYEDDSSF